MFSGALGVIPQNLDHAAVVNRPALTLHEHPLQLRLQSGQPRNTSLHGGELRTGEGIRGLAGDVFRDTGTGREGASTGARASFGLLADTARESETEVIP